MIDVRRWYGVLGADPVADTAALSIAVKENPGATLVFPCGEYAITGPLDYGSLPVRLLGEPGAIIYHAAPNQSLFRTTGTWDTLGSPDPGRPLIAAAAKAAWRLTMDTTGLAPNDLLQIRDIGQQLRANGAVMACAGQTVRVRAVRSPTEVELTGRLLYDYSAASAVRRMLPVVGNDVRGLRFLHANPRPPWGGPATMTQPSGVLRFQNTFGDIVRDVTAEGLEKQFLSLSGAIDGRYSGVRCFDARNDLLGDPYTIRIGQNCQGLLVSDCVARGGRHLVTSASNPDEPWPQFVQLSNLLASEHSSAAFDTHSGARWWTWTNCHASHASSDEKVSGDSPAVAAGFQVRAWDQRFIGCSAVGVDTAMSLYGAIRPYVRDFYAELVDYGIRVRGGGSDHDVRGVTVRDPAIAGLTVEDAPGVTPQGYPGMRLADMDVFGAPSAGAYVFSPWIGYPSVDFGSLRAVGGATDRLVGVQA